MRGWLAYTNITLRLTMRDRVALFFSYVFPLLFFFIFAESAGAEQGGVITQVVTMVLILAILGNGLFGAGVRAVQDRELNILRRFKVTPISPAPILAASMVTGWLVFLPVLLVTLALAGLMYGMPFPERWLSLFVLVSIGVLAFRAIGLIVASVVNSAQEGAILNQVLYLPMLFLSGATFPITMLPSWAQVAVQFVPASYLATGFQAIMIGHESLAQNWRSAAALLATTAVALLLSMKLFRWEKDEKVAGTAKLWVMVVLLPFLALGAWDAWTRDNLRKAKILHRDLRRSRTILIRDARIFTGDGKVIESGAVLIRDGRIADVFEGKAPEANTLRAEAVEASGKTILPALIDVRVALPLPGGVYEPAGAYRPDKAMMRAVAAYLYCGVATVRSQTDTSGIVARVRRLVTEGQWLGAEVSTGSEAGIVAGPFRGLSPPEQFARMAARGEAYVPMLSAVEAEGAILTGGAEILERSLVLQVGPPELIEGTKRMLRRTRLPEIPEKVGGAQADLEQSMENLRRAWRAGVILAVGSGAGRPLVFHGPAVHRELQLWVKAGIPPAVALEAATRNGARILGVADRIGAVRKGLEASLLLVDGNPLQDIAATERISLVTFKGERVARGMLFEQQ
jgi:imidazolonepropionase-like amidohydrolase/ABC-type multidrug transport system permease subunit